MNELSDEHLMELVIQGSSDTFERIVRRHRSGLMRFVSTKVYRWQDAEDIVQETFLKVYSNRHRFDLSGSLKTWMFTIANNCAISHLRRKKLTSESQRPHAQPIMSPAEQIDLQQQSATIWQQAKSLSENQYTALWLRYKEQMGVSQIARIMHKSRSHVRVLLHRARGKLAQILDGDAEMDAKTPMQKSPLGGI
jgi:RNA polymerase sigma-70 factor, ECF subfamily